jgi:mRNA-degrading endonuclease toxin of MazEF toxin-antitoxin module
MKQYELWWATLPAPAGRRPVLLLSRNAAYSYLNKFATVEVTSTIRRIAVEVLPRRGIHGQMCGQLRPHKDRSPFRPDQADWPIAATPAFRDKAGAWPRPGLG